MKFKKISDTHVEITDAAGAKYELKKREDIPLTRWIASMPYQIQDELQITFAGLRYFTDAFDALAKKENVGKTEIQNELARLSAMLQEKMRIAEDIATIKLQLACVFWLFNDEDETQLDPMVMVKKLQAMKTTQASYDFFLRNPLPTEISETIVTVDTVLFLAQVKEMWNALQMQPQAT